MYIISHLRDAKAKASDHKGDKFIILYDEGSAMSVEQHLLLSAPNVEFLDLKGYPSAEAAVWFTIGRRCNAKEEAAVIGPVPKCAGSACTGISIHYFESMDDLYARPQAKKKPVKKPPVKAPAKAADGAGAAIKDAPEQKGEDPGSEAREQDGATEGFRKLLEGFGEEAAENWEYILAGIQRSSSVYSLGQCLSMHLLDKDLSRRIGDSIRESYGALREAAVKCPPTNKVKNL